MSENEVQELMRYIPLLIPLIIIQLWTEPIQLGRLILQALAFLWLVPVLLVLLFRFLNPPVSLYMLQTKWKLKSTGFN